MLFRQKLIGQLEILKRFREPEAIRTVEEIVKQIDRSENTDELRWLESRAANQYWKAWRDIQIIFVERDSDKIPEHWHTFGTRSSLISSPSARRASNPINAILNYLYSILESESRIAALAVGLDPGIGVMHTDLRSRDSLACDVMAH